MDEKTKKINLVILFVYIVIFASFFISIKKNIKRINYKVNGIETEAYLVKQTHYRTSGGRGRITAKNTIHIGVYEFDPIYGDKIYAQYSSTNKKKIVDIQNVYYMEDDPQKFIWKENRTWNWTKEIMLLFIDFGFLILVGTLFKKD